MSLDQTQNFVRATIASAVDSADTTIDVTDSNQLPDPADGEYNLILWDVSTFPRPGQDPAVEVVRATALDESADTLSVDRGQENTTAADHPETAVLQLSPTAKMFADIDAKTSALSADGQTFAGESVDVTQSLTDPTGTTHNKIVGAFGTATPTAYFSAPAHGEGSSAFIGATLAPDGRVIFAPNSSSNVGIFDPSDDTYTSGPAHGEGGGAFVGATLSPDGRVIFAPNSSSNVGIVSQLLDFAVAANANK